MRRTYIYKLRTGGKLVWTRQLDRNDGGGLPIAAAKGTDLRLPNEFCRSAFPPESKMRAVLMVVTNILREQSLQMAFIHRDNVVQ